MAPAHSYFESPESASPIVTRAVSAGLRAEFCDAYRFSSWQRIALWFLGLFPQAVARFAVSRFETISGLNPRVLSELNSNHLVEERLKDYSGLSGRFPTITVGSALAGASAHLALATGGPFLPQAFVTTIRGGAPDGDVQVYFQRSAELARKISLNNPGLLTIQHYDPIHDAWMTRFTNHLRFKLLTLPQAYADFITRYLEPGGSVCYLDCQAQWLRYRLAERNVFQVGGWGDIPPEEFINGSERIKHYCRAAGFKSSDWRLDDYPLEQGPESEWGSEAGLAEALETFCDKQGFCFERITLSQPHDYSLLAFRAIACLLDKEGRKPPGVLIEMFSQFDATAVMESGLLPLWLVFNTQDSLEFLRAMRQFFPENKPVFFSPLSTFTLTPDLVPWESWEETLQGLDWKNIGARSSHYPADAWALTGWANRLRDWVSANNNKIQTRLAVEELRALALEIKKSQRRQSLNDPRAPSTN